MAKKIATEYVATQWNVKREAENTGHESSDPPVERVERVEWRKVGHKGSKPT